MENNQITVIGRLRARTYLQSCGCGVEADMSDNVLWKSKLWQESRTRIRQEKLLVFKQI